MTYERNDFPQEKEKKAARMCVCVGVFWSDFSSMFHGLCVFAHSLYFVSFCLLKRGLTRLVY